MSDITIEEVKKELENFKNNNVFFMCNGCYSIQGKKGKCQVCGGKLEKQEHHTNDVFPQIAELCIKQDEKILKLTKKLDEAKSLLKEHHQDRLGDYYYDTRYDLFNETVEFVK